MERLARLAALVLAVAPVRALAHGGEPHDAPTVVDLYEHAPTPPGAEGGRAPTTGGAALGLTQGVGLGGDGERGDVRAFVRDTGAWVGARAEGQGYLALLEAPRGVRLAPDAAWMLAAVSATGGARPERALERLDVSALAWERGPWSAGLGQLVLRHNGLLQTDTTALDIGWVRWADDVQLGSHVRLEATAYLSANLFQESTSASPLLRGIEDGIRACASQSEIGLSLALVVAERVTVSAFAIDQDDPFHFVSGAECFGDGALWVQSSLVGAGLDVALGSGVTLALAVRWATAELGYDLEQRHGRALYGEVRTENLAASVTLSVAP